MAALTGSAVAAGLDCDIYRQEPSATLMNIRSVGMVTGAPGGIYSALGQNLAALLDDRCSAKEPFRVIVMQGIGSRGNLDDIKNLRRVDIGLVQSDVLESLQGEEGRRAHDDMRYIAPLHHEVIHILAVREINKIEDLDGKEVNIDAPGSGTQFTARGLFARLNLKPKIDQAPTTQALGRLISGDLDALIYVSGRGANIFTRIQAPQVIARGLHFVALPYTLADKFEPTYQRTKLTRDDYNALVRPGEEVEAWAARAIMAVYAWDRDVAKNRDRYAAVKLFIDQFFRSVPRLGEAPYRGFWCEVDLRDTVSGWVRFDAASLWLAANPSAQTKPCEGSAPVPPSLACERSYVDRIRQDTGVTPNLSNPYWRGEFEAWKQGGASCK